MRRYREWKSFFFIYILKIVEIIFYYDLIFIDFCEKSYDFGKTGRKVDKKFRI